MFLRARLAKIVERGLRVGPPLLRGPYARSQCRQAALRPQAGRRCSRHRRRDRRPRRSGRPDAGQYGRQWRCPSGWSRLASAMACWNSMAAPSASTALANSTNAPSPVSLTRRPPWRASVGSKRSVTMALEPGERAALVTAHQARIANDICSKDRRQTSCPRSPVKKPPPRVNLPRCGSAARLVCILGIGRGAVVAVAAP